MPVLCLLSLISRNKPKQLGMVSPELKQLGMVSPELPSDDREVLILGIVPKAHFGTCHFVGVQRNFGAPKPKKGRAFGAW